MLTINHVLRNYCKEKNLPTPSRDDLRVIGQSISRDFRLWATNQPEDIIPDSGFVKISENMRIIVVNGYPNIFREEMIKRFEIYYAWKERVEKEKKQAPFVEPVTVFPEKKVRKRIPAKSTKVTSATPSINNHNDIR